MASVPLFLKSKTGSNKELKCATIVRCYHVKYNRLPVCTILSILMLELSSSLAKACTACSRSSQVSGSM